MYEFIAVTDFVTMAYDNAVSVITRRDGSKRRNLDCVLPEALESGKVDGVAGVVAS
jgi:hypothetical protein